jgi:hypothetical protein
VTEFAINADFLDSFTLDELEVVEDVVGVPADEFLDGKTPVSKAKLMKAIALVVKRRTDPAVTLEQVGKLTFVELDTLLDEVAAVPPGHAAG